MARAGTNGCGDAAKCRRWFPWTRPGPSVAAVRGPEGPSMALRHGSHLVEGDQLWGDHALVV